MRLRNGKIVDFLAGEFLPEYAIFSHTWGKDDEVRFEDVEQKIGTRDLQCRQTMFEHLAQARSQLSFLDDKRQRRLIIIPNISIGLVQALSITAQTSLRPGYGNFHPPPDVIHWGHQTSKSTETSKPCDCAEFIRDSDFWEKFYGKQWRFRVPMKCANQDFLQDTILPTVDRKSLESGGSGEVWKIQIHPECDKLFTDQTPSLREMLLLPTSSLSKDDSSLLMLLPQKPKNFTAYTFALKTFNASDAEISYARELEAFRGLQQRGLNTGLRLHGSCTKGNPYNILLEYCDERPLQNYLQNELPPVHEEEITRFWEGLFRIAEGLKGIHETQANRSHIIFHEGHQDVKPENILVFSESQYESNGVLRLADMGLSRFKKIDVDPSKVHGRFGIRRAFSVWSRERQSQKPLQLQTLRQIQGQMHRLKKYKAPKTLGTCRLVWTSSQIFMLMYTWFLASIGTVLSFITRRKSRPKVHSMQAMLMSLLLWTSPVTATSVGKGPGLHCSSFLDTLYLDLQTLILEAPQPPFPRSFPAPTLLVATLLFTTWIVLLFSFLRSRPRANKSLLNRLLLTDILLSALAGAMFAKDVPDLIFRYIFFGTNGGLVSSTLVRETQSLEQIVDEMGLADVEEGNEKGVVGFEEKMDPIKY